MASSAGARLRFGPYTAVRRPTRGWTPFLPAGRLASAKTAEGDGGPARRLGCGSGVWPGGRRRRALEWLGVRLAPARQDAATIGGAGRVGAVWSVALLGGSVGTNSSTAAACVRSSGSGSVRCLSHYAFSSKE